MKSKENLCDITDESLSKFNSTQVGDKQKYQDVLNKQGKFNYSQFEDSFATENVFKNVLISQVFSGWEDRFFTEFCRSENLTYVDDITLDHLKKFQLAQGIGQKRYLDVLNSLEGLVNKLRQLKESCFTVGEIYEYAKNLKISEIISLLRPDDILYSDANLFFLEENLTSEVKDVLFYQNVKLFELEKKPFKELGHISKIENLIIISNELSKIQTPRDALLKYKSRLSENQQLVLKMRILEERTLGEVGKELNLTKERIRQLETKIKRQINGLFRLRLNDILMLISEEVNYITSRELAGILGEENKDAVKVLKSSDASLYYNRELDIFFFKELDKVEIQARIDFFLSELPEIFRYSDYKHLFDEIFPLSSTFSFEMIYDKYDFNKSGEFYSSRKLNLIDILNLIFKHFVKNPIKLDEDGTKRIVLLAKTYFNVELSNDMRAIDSRARNSDQLLLVDKLTYQWFDPTTIDKKLLIDILDYLNHELKIREFVNTEQVFSRFKSRLDEHQISNKTHLYSVIKYFLGDQLIVGKGNTLNIFPVK